MSNDQISSVKNALTNRGISILNHAETDEPRTIVVVGCARGGTSIVAGVLHTLGVFMGNARAPVFEDATLAMAFETQDYEKAEKMIADYNCKHQIWAFKRPSCVNYLPEIHTRFRAPRYVFIFRDVLSIAIRNSISMRTDIIKSMDVALGNYKKMIEFIQSHNPTAMLVSAEKLLADKNHFISTLSEFIGYEPTEEAVAAALRFIEPNPLQYLDRSRITLSVGSVDQITANSVVGWAKLVHSNQPPTVEIYINDTLVGEVLSDRVRGDQLGKGSDESASGGFRFDFPEKAKSGDILRIRVKHDVRDLCVHEFRQEPRILDTLRKKLSFRDATR